jgi:hypothetical protein
VADTRECRDGWAARRWYCYMGRFPVPDWLFNISPQWMHSAADWLGGVEPSPWVELRDRVLYSRPALFIYRIVKGEDRV